MNKLTSQIYRVIVPKFIRKRILANNFQSLFKTIIPTFLKLLPRKFKLC